MAKIKKAPCLVMSSIRWGFEPNTFDVYLKLSGDSPFDGKANRYISRVSLPMTFPDYNSDIQMEVVPGSGLFGDKYNYVFNPIVHTYGLKLVSLKYISINLDSKESFAQKIVSGRSFLAFTVKVIGTFPDILSIANIAWRISRLDDANNNQQAEFTVGDNLGFEYDWPFDGSDLFYPSRGHSKEWSVGKKPPKNYNGYGECQYVAGVALK